MNGDLKIAIDIATLDRGIERISRSYTSFGDAVRSISDNVEGSVARLLDEASEVSLPLKPLTQGAVGIQGAEYISMETYLRQWEREDRRLSDTIEKLGTIKLGRVIEGAMPELKVEQPPVDIHVPEVDAAANRADLALRGAEKTFDKIQKTEDAAIKRIGRLRTFVENEVRTTKKSIRDLISKIPGGLVGGFVAGLVGTIILGYQERNRRRAEMGEMSNVFVGGLDSIFATETRKAVRWFGNWAERAQWHYGVGRKEVQKTIEEMVNNGFKAAEMIERYDKGLGQVGRNVVITSIGLDKHFNFATGTSMEYIVSFVRDYGMELKSATDLFSKMTMAGQRSGMGTMNFVRAVMSSQDSLAHFGINAGNVAVLMEKVIGFYTDMGLQQRYAGNQAVGVVQDLMTAFSDLDDGMKVVLARRMYQDEETDAYSLLMQFQDGLRRISQGEEDQYLENLLRSYITMMRETGLGGRSRMIRTIQQNLNVRNRTAQLLYDAGDLIVKGGKLKDLSKEERGNLKRAFKVEQTQVSRLHRMRRELIRGMADLGGALMAVVSDIIGILVIGIRSLPAMVLGYQRDQLGEVVANVIVEQNRRIREMTEHWKVGEGGINTAARALGNEFSGVFQPLIDALSGKVKGAPTRPPQPGETIPAKVKEVLGMSPDQLKQRQTQMKLWQEWMGYEDVPSGVPPWMEAATETGELRWINGIAHHVELGRRFDASGQELERIPGTYELGWKESLDDILNPIANLVVGAPMLDEKEMADIADDTTGAKIARGGKSHEEFVRQNIRDYEMEQMRKRVEQESGGKVTVAPVDDFGLLVVPNADQISQENTQ